MSIVDTIKGWFGAGAETDVVVPPEESAQTEPESAQTEPEPEPEVKPAEPVQAEEEAQEAPVINPQEGVSLGGGSQEGGEPPAQSPEGIETERQV